MLLKVNGVREKKQTQIVPLRRGENDYERFLERPYTGLAALAMDTKDGRSAEGKTTPAGDGQACDANQRDTLQVVKLPRRPPLFLLSLLIREAVKEAATQTKQSTHYQVPPHRKGSIVSVYSRCAMTLRKQL